MGRSGRGDCISGRAGLAQGALAGAGVALCVLLLRLISVGSGPIGTEPIVAMMRDASTPMERLLVSGDGQAHALVAADPTIGTGGLYTRGSAGLAYRAQRPLFGSIAWVFSLGGERELIPLGVALTWVLGGALLGAGASRFCDLRWVVGAVAVGHLMALRSPVAEPMAVGILLLGLAQLSKGRDLGAAALFALAGLLKETVLLVAAAVVIHSLIRHRWRTMFIIAIAAVPYALWLVYLYVRLGAWPWEAGVGRLGSPLGGAGVVRAWGPMEVVLGIALLGLAAMLWRSSSLGRWIVALHGVLLALSGSDVWSSALNVGRVVLPVPILGIVLFTAERPPVSPSLTEAVRERR